MIKCRIDKLMNKQKNIIIALICILSLLYIGNVIYVKTAVKESRLAILGYHHIVSDEDKEKYYKYNMWVGSVSSFQAQMKLLHDEGYKSVTLDEVYAWKKGKLELPKKAVAITIDDGFYSAIKYIAPILKTYGFTAASFVIGSAIPKQHEPYRADIRQHASLADMKDQSILHFYAHSYDLHKKGKANGEFAVNEKTKEELIKDTQKEKPLVSIAYYAYPYGKYNPLIQDVLKEAGTKLAFGFNENRKATRKDSDYGLPRFCVNAYTKLDVFKAMLESDE